MKGQVEDTEREEGKTGHSIHLKQLTLKNFVTFEFQEIHFHQGFNAIIGETGSGKSLILSALQIILGERADRKLIRKNCEYALVEATFVCNDARIKRYFAHIGHPFDENEISIKRLIYPNGKSRAFMNFIPCQLATLLEFARSHIDLVGQFENQKLLGELYQLQLIDIYSDLGPTLANYQREFKLYREHSRELEAHRQDQSIRSQKAAFLEFQIQEIDRLSPSVEDELSLLEKKREHQHREKREKLIGDILGGGGEELVSSIKRILHLCHKNADILPAPLISKLEEAHTHLEEVSFEMARELNKAISDDSIDEILERLDLYQKLKRKFGGTTLEVLGKRAEMERDWQGLADLDGKIRELETIVKEKQKGALALAKGMHKIRLAKAIEISERMTQIVRQLHMNDASIKIEVTEKADLDEYGLSKVAFSAETNLGDGHFPIKDIASGGELSRILLAFRQVLAVKDSISIFLFDEIDTGMGGVTALRIGKSLGVVAKSSQVIAITHLPQIAHHADKLIVVSKEGGGEALSKGVRSNILHVTGKSMKAQIESMVPLH